jgi:hypothetical protein
MFVQNLPDFGSFINKLTGRWYFVILSTNFSKGGYGNETKHHQINSFGSCGRLSEIHTFSLNP